MSRRSPRAGCVGCVTKKADTCGLTEAARNSTGGEAWAVLRVCHVTLGGDRDSRRGGGGDDGYGLTSVETSASMALSEMGTGGADCQNSRRPPSCCVR